MNRFLTAAPEKFNRGVTQRRFSCFGEDVPSHIIIDYG
jgi:hypothetical protein